MSTHLILKHLISSVVRVAKIVSPSVALPAELVSQFDLNKMEVFRSNQFIIFLSGVLLSTHLQ